MRNLKRILPWLLTALLSLPLGAAEKFYPEVLMRLDDLFTHHILVAEKSTHRLHLFKNENGRPKLLKSYEVATGKKAGNKSIQGDHRTPEGVYRFTEFLTHNQLLERHGKEVGAIYGVGAFVMDYPNPIDRILGKTGGGIWLHSTNDETRIDNGLDSRGCIVSTNRDLIELSDYLDLQRSSVVVVQDLRYLPAMNWEKNRQQVDQFLSSWLNSWREMDLDSYLGHYHTKEFWDPNRPSFSAFKTYKRAVFQQTQKPKIEVSQISILGSGLSDDDYLKVTFLQHYESATLSDLGRKTLYLKRDESYNWKIVSELWSKHGVPESLHQGEGPKKELASRFFESRDPAEILQVEYRERRSNSPN